MNSIVEAILRRHSVRDGFSSASVSVEVLEEIVRCGLAAPSAKNARPWRFHVVTDRLVLAELAELVESSEGIETYVPFDPATGRRRPDIRSSVVESAAVLRNVPVGILVENTGPFSRGRDALQNAASEALAPCIVGYAFEMMGVGAAVQNMWIAAEAHGLVGVLIGDVLIAERRIQQRLGIACDLAGVLALGYAGTRSAHSTQDRARFSVEQAHWVPPRRRAGRDQV